MKDLKAIRGEFLLRRLIAEGEHENQDFKFTVNDPRKIARTVSAFANNTGGRLLIGVDDNGNPRGIMTEEDIYVVESAASIYCTPACDLDFSAYKVKGGATVIVAEVAVSQHKPVFVKEDKGLLKAYFRVKDENIAAEPLMVRAWASVTDKNAFKLIDFSSETESILDSLRDKPLTFDEISRKVSVSRNRLENNIIQLYRLGVIDFVFIDRIFKIKLKEE